MRVCAVIPAYQEEGRIGGVVSEALRYVGEVIVVDDGSQDRTADEAREAGATVVRHETNLGKGAALLRGFREARAAGFESAVALDADGQHSPAEIPLLLSSIAGADLVLGNRMGTPDEMPLVRRLTNRVMSAIISRLCRQRLADTQTGFRAVRLEPLLALDFEASRFDFESEMLIKMARADARIREVPVTTVYGVGEHSKIRPARDTVRFIKVLLRSRWW